MLPPQLLARHPQAPRHQNHRHSRRRLDRNPASREEARRGERRGELQRPAEQRKAGASRGRPCSLPHDPQTEREGGPWYRVACHSDRYGCTEEVACRPESQDVRYERAKSPVHKGWQGCATSKRPRVATKLPFTTMTCSPARSTLFYRFWCASHHLDQARSIPLHTHRPADPIS